MEQQVCLIGFGEAGQNFAAAGDWAARAHIFDRKTDSEADRPTMIAAYTAAGVIGAPSLGSALRGAEIVLSLVTADQALAAAEAAAPFMPAAALYCDCNSVAPETKRAAARAIEAAGAHYIDVAIMAPVDPARLAVLLLLSGMRAGDARDRLEALGFVDINVAGDAVGRASAIKMIRSVMIKGMEALTAECVLAAEAAGVRDEVFASLDASEKAIRWDERADYNLGRMLIHGRRRAAEMEEAVKTLESLGTGAAMTRSTIERQRAIGTLGMKAPPDGLAAKIGDILRKQTESGKAIAA